MNFWKKYIDCKNNTLLALSLLTIISSAVLADWDPEILWDKDPSCLQSPQYIQLKADIISSLKGSWCSEEKTNLLMDLILLEQPSICVEIGVFTGSSVLPVATTLKFLKKGKIFAVDAWSNQIAVRNWDDNDPNKAWWSSLDMKAISKSFKSMIKDRKLQDFCTVISLPSEEAINQIESIDFLHLDGDYSEIGSMQDIELYLPKVKSGGYILLSNLFTMINGKQPKAKAFSFLMESCEMICEIERDNAILFKKY